MKALFTRLAFWALTAPLCLAGDLPPGFFPLADLSPLPAFLRDAQLIGIGESLHGSDGYHQIRARVIRYLIETQDVRAIALETNWRKALAATRYVATCAGDPLQALRDSFFNVWQSDVDLDLLKWLCAFNQAHPGDPVVFYGFDIQEPVEDGNALRRYLPKAAPADAKALLAGLASCYGARYSTEAEFFASPEHALYEKGLPVHGLGEHRSCLDGAHTIGVYLSSHEKALLQAEGAESLSLARLSAEGLEAFENEIYFSPTSTDLSFTARDQAMDRVFEALRELYFAGKKTVIWAHDDHIAKNIPEARAPMNPSYTWTSLGTFLSRQHGADYATIGMIGYDVGILGPTQVAPPADSSWLEYRLHQLALPGLLIDPSSPYFDPLAPVKMAHKWEMIPARQFDALIYLDQSPPMKLAQ